MARSLLTRSVRRRPAAWALLIAGAISLLPLACGDGGSQSGESPEEILEEALGGLGILVPVKLDTAALARAVQAGQAISLPFAQEGGRLVDRDVQLTLRNLRAPDLTGFVLKDGVRQRGSTEPLPAPATYQGIVTPEGDGAPGAAVLTITARVVAGNLLVAPEGWSIIEPLEPMLRLRNVEPRRRQRVLRKYNHVVYNSRDSRAGVSATGSGVAPAALSPGAAGRGRGTKTAGLVLSVVGDGDAELFRAYPLDSVMPFWLLQETFFNAVDWLYSCVEPEPNEHNAHTTCDNRFDGGGDHFQARVRIDRLETWTAGGPTSSGASAMLVESAQATHQATPVCCGEPHTAGRSDHVHFFSGKVFSAEAGHASVAGLNIYGAGCEQPYASFCCHHAVSQVVPGGGTPGTFFQLQNLVAHELGHNAGGAEDRSGFAQEWLFGAQSGPTLMYSGFDGFPAEEIFVYSTDAARDQIAPILESRLGAAPDVDTPCASGPTN